MKSNNKVEPTDIFPPIIWKKFEHPWETFKFWIICIFWQDAVVSRIFTHASPHIEHPVTVREMFPTDSESAPLEWQNEAEDACTRIGQVECTANLVGFLNLDFNPRATFKTPFISRFWKHVTFMNKNRALIDRKYGVLNQYHLKCYFLSKCISHYRWSRKKISWDRLFYKTSRFNCLLPWSMLTHFDFANNSWAFMNMHILFCTG